jgi:hypothetical protein
MGRENLLKFRFLQVCGLETAPLPLQAAGQ